MKDYKVFSDDSGQAYTEWILVVVLVMVPIYWIFNTFIKIIDFYSSFISFFIQLPFP